MVAGRDVVCCQSLRMCISISVPVCYSWSLVLVDWWSFAVSSLQVIHPHHSRHLCTGEQQLSSGVQCTACARRNSAIIALWLGNSCPGTWVVDHHVLRMSIGRHQEEAMNGRGWKQKLMLVETELEL